MRADLPSVNTLTWAQYSGWACVLCGGSLATTGGESVGRAEGSSGAHDLSVEVYACLPCAKARIPQQSSVASRQNLVGNGGGLPAHSP